MYAVIRAGGKQHKVQKGDVIQVELIRDGENLQFAPLLVVDDDGKARAGSAQLKGATVTAKVLGEAKGDKLQVAKFRNKTRYRRTTGHRQRYSNIEISDIKLTGATAKKTTAKPTTKKTTAKKPTAKKTTAKKTTAKKTTAKKTTTRKKTGDGT